MKKESSGAGATHENQERRSWNHVHEKNSGAEAVTFSRRLRSADVIDTVACRAHRRSRVKIQQINCFSNNLQRLS